MFCFNFVLFECEFYPVSYSRVTGIISRRTDDNAKLAETCMQINFLMKDMDKLENKWYNYETRKVFYSTVDNDANKLTLRFCHVL